MIEQQDITEEADSNKAAFYRALGRRIRFGRMQLGLSQEELSGRIGYTSPTTVSYWETAMRRPSLYDLRQIARVLQVPLSSLLNLNEDVDSFLDAWDWFPFERVQGLSPQAQKDLVQYVEYLRWREANGS